MIPTVTAETRLKVSNSLQSLSRIFRPRGGEYDGGARAPERRHTNSSKQSVHFFDAHFAQIFDRIPCGGFEWLCLFRCTFWGHFGFGFWIQGFQISRKGFFLKKEKKTWLRTCHADLNLLEFRQGEEDGGRVPLQLANGLRRQILMRFEISDSKLET